MDGFMQPRYRLPGTPRSAAPRGTIVVYMLIILSVLILSVVATTTTSSGVQVQVASLTLKRDQAYFAAEAGIQRALYEVQFGSWQSTSTYPTLNGDTGACTYTVTGSGSGWNSPAMVTVVGRHKTDTSVTCTINVSFQPRQIIPAISLGSGIKENGNLTVDGNALVKGNLELGGKVAINGTVVYGGANNGVHRPNFVHWDPALIPMPPAVWYDATETLTPPSNVVNVTPMVKPSNGAKHLGTGTPNVLDFRSAPNGVLFYNGNVTLKNVTVHGKGTLVAFGNVVIQNGGFGDSLDPVNIVSTGTISTQANFRIYGSLYANGDITHQGQFDVTGTINGQGSMLPTQSNGGAGGATINRAPPPSFDPRPVVGSGSMLVTNFTGPSF